MGSGRRGWWVDAAAAAAGAAVVASLSARDPGRSLDLRVFSRLNADRGPAADRFFRGVTELGSIAASIGGCAALMARGRTRVGIDALGAAASAWLLGQWLKGKHLRDRPYQSSDHPTRLLIGEPPGTSWPSSHPAVLLAFVTVAARDLGVGASKRGGLNGLAGLVGLSRIYNGVHYPSDVAGGLLMGRATADVWSSVVSGFLARSRAAAGTVSE
jgi:membrane-associated phospholipid phosphatase